MATKTPNWLIFIYSTIWIMIFLSSVYFIYRFIEMVKVRARK